MRDDGDTDQGGDTAEAFREEGNLLYSHYVRQGILLIAACTDDGFHAGTFATAGT